MTLAQILSIAIFAGVLILIISEKVHRALAALLGAVLVFMLQLMPFDEGLEHIDFNTLGVLVGMMLFVSVAKRSGLFEYLAIKAAKAARGDPWRIMVFLMLITAALSALLDNVTTVLLIGPMTLMICRELRINPVPFFITQILASNIGGTATLIGDPPNIMIGSAADLSFLDFLLIDGPIVVLILIATIIGFKFIYARHLTADAEDMQALLNLDEHEAITSKSLFVKSVVMIVLVAAAFTLHGLLHVDSAVIALSAAAIMLLIGRVDIEEALLGVEWTTIGFFAGLFIVVGGMAATGVIEIFAQFLAEATHSNSLAALLLILGASALISAVLDNIPFVATMIPVLLSMGASGVDIYPLWWALSLGACLGGNGTLIGASANVVLSGISTREGYPLSYLAYLKIGAPMMVLSIILSGIYLYVRFCLFQ
ncbi:MAG: ArsB/NhaD family transporter [Coriobacteriales bacterium]|jgi:Na+/H+ antiporter NhaD/arsenite permease-like protein|nr:ArsB/NhaD family transporter [Coriobacteriales bacterium]